MFYSLKSYFFSFYFYLFIYLFSFLLLLYSIKLDWLNSENVFGFLVGCLSLSEYREALLSGLLMTIGASSSLSLSSLSPSQFVFRTYLFSSLSHYHYPLNDNFKRITGYDSSNLPPSPLLPHSLPSSSPFQLLHSLYQLAQKFKPNDRVFLPLCTTLRFNLMLLSLKLETDKVFLLQQIEQII